MKSISGVNFVSLDYKEIGNELKQKVDDYYNYISSTGRLGLWRKSYQKYYGGFYNDGSVNKDGQQDELRKVNINQYRNILQHILVLVTSNKVSFEAKAVNTDVKSSAQCILANSVLEYLRRAKYLDKHLYDVAETSIIFGEGWSFTGWDYKQGDPYTADANGEIVMSGDISYNYYNPIDVIRDVSLPNCSDHNWYILCDYKNRYEIAAKYPNYTDDIINSEDSYSHRWNIMLENDSRYIYNNTDIIRTYTFIHRKTGVLPNGRMVVFLEDGTVLFDGEYPYETFTLARMAPSEQKATSFGYSIGFDLLALQDISDSLNSTIVTNQNAFGVQNILCPDGSKITPENIGGALRFLYHDPNLKPPEPLNLLSTPAEVFNYNNYISSQMETISGVNSVARGNIPSDKMSGSALALIQTQAIQFNSGVQQSYARLSEDVGTNSINIMKNYVTVPKLVQITGKANKTYTKEFVGKDLDGITRVTVDLGNPLSQTLGGRIEFAKDLLNSGLIKNPEQYLQIQSTGRIEQMFESQTAEMLLIKDENEKLLANEMPTALITDNHAKHIPEHNSVLNGTDSRNNPEIVTNVLNHIQKHINLWRDADPNLLAGLNIPPFFNIQPPPQPQEQQGAPQEQMVNNAEPVAQMPNQPNLPNNPLSGQKWNPQTGGM